MRREGKAPDSQSVPIRWISAALDEAMLIFNDCFVCLLYVRVQ